MKALLILLLVVATRAQDDGASKAAENDGNLGPCKEAYDACRAAWLVSSKVATDVETKCRNAETWSECLASAVADGKCVGDEGIPDQLLEDDETYCSGSFHDDCKYSLNECKTAWETASAKAGSDQCELARQRHNCADVSVATGHCDAIPDDVKQAVTDSCGGNTDDKCLALVSECQATWKSKYSEEHPNSVKCTLAHSWAKCINDHINSAPVCQASSTPPYPRDLAVQNAYCYVDDEQDECTAGEDLCKDAWSKQLSAGTVAEQCQAAQSWSDCLSDSTLEKACPNGITVPTVIEELLGGACLEQQDTVSCADQEASCGQQYQNPAPGENRCKQAEAWELCLSKVKANGCDVIVPLALTQEKRDYCKGKDAQASCPVRIAQCGATFDQMDASADRCQQSRQWRQCLEDLFSVCDDVQFPKSLDEMEAYSCFSPALTCLQKQTACKSAYLQKVKLTGDSCDLVKEWRACLVGLVDNDECEISFPQELDVAEVDNCYKRRGTVACGDEQAKCMKTFDEADVTSDTCQNVRAWRSCLERLMSSCSVIFPMKLNMAEATSCYGPKQAQSPVQDKAQDAGGAPMSCSDREDACRRENVLTSSATVSRCGQAKNWRSCLEGLMGKCTVSFPQELDKLDANNCYGQAQGGSDDQKTGKDQNQDQSKKKDDDNDNNDNDNDDDDDDKDDNKDAGKSSCSARASACRPKKPKACRHAKVWRSCLDQIKDECGMGIYTQELNTLQATKC